MLYLRHLAPPHAALDRGTDESQVAVALAFWIRVVTKKEKKKEQHKYFPIGC